MSADNERVECRKCGCRHFYVVYTRPRMRGIMRVRRCRNCGTRLVTWERPVLINRVYPPPDGTDA